jgi:hypothetical protein
MSGRGPNMLEAAKAMGAAAALSKPFHVVDLDRVISEITTKI